MSLFTHLRSYTRRDAWSDAIAGALTAAVLIPQALAFAALAGLPPQAGLYASVLPPLAYALLGGSRVMAVGPVSVAALMVASALAGVAGDAMRIEAAATLALLVAGFFVLAGLLRAGALINFISGPVLHGFTSGAAVLIMVSQLPALLGLGKGAWAVSPVMSVTAALGLGSLALLFGVQGFAGWVAARYAGRAAGPGSAGSNTPGGAPDGVSGGAARNAPLAITLLGRAAPLVAVLLATWAVVIWNLDTANGVAVTGAVTSAWPAGLGAHLMPDWQRVRESAPAAALIALIAYVESAAIAKLFATRDGETVNANRELLALGAANLAAAASATMPVAGGFSRTAVNAVAGARTQLATIVTVILLLAATALLAGVIARMPRAALAAVIIAGVVKLIDWREPLRLWRYDRAEASVFMLTAVLTAAVDIELGLLAGLALSLLWPVWQARAPHIALLGRIPGSRHYRNIARHPAEAWPDLLLVRVDGALSAANAAHVTAWVTRAVAARNVGANSAGAGEMGAGSAAAGNVAAGNTLRHVVMDAGGVHAIDATALEAMEQLAHTLAQQHIGLHWAELRGPVTDRLTRAGQLRRLGPGTHFLNVDTAVRALAAEAQPHSPHPLPPALAI